MADGGRSQGETLAPRERASLERTGRLRHDRERELGAAVARRPASTAARSTDPAVYVEEILERPRGDGSVEADLVVRAAGGDVRARELLVEGLLSRLLGLARRFRRSGVDVADLMQEGFLAVFDALQRFDPARGTPFWSYAAPWVHGAMHRLAQDHSRALRLPPRALSDLSRLKMAVAELSESGSEVSIPRAARRCGLDVGRAFALAAAGRPVRSLDEPVTDEHGAASLVDVLPDPRAEAEYDAVVESASRPELRTLLGSLTARERDIVARRHGVGRGRQTLDEIARDLGVTRERVRQLEARAVAKLRASADAL